MAGWRAKTGLGWRFLALAAISTPLTCLFLTSWVWVLGLPSMTVERATTWMGITWLLLYVAIRLLPLTLPLAAAGFAWGWSSAVKAGHDERHAGMRGATGAAFFATLPFVMAGPAGWIFFLIAATLAGWAGAALLYRRDKVPAQGMQA